MEMPVTVRRRTNGLYSYPVGPLFQPDKWARSFLLYGTHARSAPYPTLESNCAKAVFVGGGACDREQLRTTAAVPSSPETLFTEHMRHTCLKPEAS